MELITANVEKNNIKLLYVIEGMLINNYIFCIKINVSLMLKRLSNMKKNYFVESLMISLCEISRCLILEGSFICEMSILTDVRPISSNGC